MGRDYCLINMSADLLWILTKRNNSFLLKRSGNYFSHEPNNSTGISSYHTSGLVNSQSIGIGTDGKNIVMTQRAPGKRAFNLTVTPLSRHGGKPAKLSEQSAVIMSAGSKKEFTAAALLKWSRLTQVNRLKPKPSRPRDGPRA